VRGSGGAGDFRSGSAGVGRGESNRWGPVDREMRERRPAREGVIRKGKRIFREDAIDAKGGQQLAHSVPHRGT
jgi:hypothetical protein